MVFHDWDLDRLTDAAGAIIDHSSTQLGAIALSGAEGRIPPCARCSTWSPGARRC
jgi:predicted PP-loop superfamily ATPase